MFPRKIDDRRLDIQPADTFGLAHSFPDRFGNRLGPGDDTSAQPARISFAEADDIHPAVVRRFANDAADLAGADV
jgi:hypothetical protein